MMEKDEQNMSDEQALQNFLLDIKCLDELLPWTEKFNMFDVLKISRTEIRHSNMLGWLLDANENHGFGEEFLRGVLQKITQNDEFNRYDVFKLLLMDLYSFRVFREWRNIDILLVSDEEKFVLAIENKVGSHEHSNQLNRYREILEMEYSEYDRIYIYLTPDGEEPSDTAHWGILSYHDIVEVLEEIQKRLSVKADVDLMVRNYIEVIRRDIVEDQKLIEICNKIYNKHRKALDLIFENRTDGKMRVSDTICNTLLKLCEEGKIIYEDGWGYNFRTKAMDKVLPMLDEPISSWNTYNIYCYWFMVREGRFYLIFELAGLNVPEETMEIIQKMIDIMKPNDKRRTDFTYKRIFKTKWYDINDTNEVDEEIEKLVRNAVAEILNMEENLLKQIK